MVKGHHLYWMGPHRLNLQHLEQEVLTRLHWLLPLNYSDYPMVDWFKLLPTNRNLHQEDHWLQVNSMVRTKWDILHHQVVESIDLCLQLETRSLERKNSLKSIPRSRLSSVPLESTLVRRMKIDMFRFKILSKSCLLHLNNCSEKMSLEERTWDLLSIKIMVVKLSLLCLMVSLQERLVNRVPLHYSSHSESHIFLHLNS